MTYGGTVRPFATAFWATSPAATITLGFDVLVQLVMAAMATEPWRIVASVPATGAEASRRSAPSPKPCGPTGAVRLSRKVACTSDSVMRSCGRFGPAIDGCTLARSSSMMDSKVGSGVSSVRKRPCAFVYCSTRSTVASSRLVRRR